MASLSIKTAFVTGATGFVGLHVVEQLHKRDVHITALARATSDTTYLRRYAPTLARGALDNLPSLERAIPEGCDVVFHVAGNTSAWRRDAAEQHRDNVLGTRNVVEAALRRGARRFVYTSSESAYGPPSITPFDETMPSNAPSSKSSYERTKWGAEQEVRRGMERGLSAVIVNPCHIVGRYDTRSWARVFRLIRDRKLPGVPDGVGSWVSAEEVGKAHLAAAERGGEGENYLLGGVEASYLEAFTIIAKLLGRKPPRVLPRWLLSVYARILDLGTPFYRTAPDITPELVEAACSVRVANSEKAERLLGLRAVPLETLLRESHAWLVGEKLL